MKGSEGLSPAFPKGLVQGGPGAPLVDTGPPVARGLLLAVAGSSGEETEGPAAGSRPPSLPSLKKLGAQGAWVCLPCDLSRFPQQQDSVTAFLLEASWARLEVAQKDFGAVGSAMGTGKYGQR